MTVSPRGTYANVGVPGTGLSYRTKLDLRPEPRKGLLNEFQSVAEDTPVSKKSYRTHEQLLRDLLRDREKGVVDWSERAGWLDAPRPDDDDEDAFDAYTFKFAAARFAKRMVDGDKAAWSEVIREELLNEQLPFGFAFGWGIDETTGLIHVDIELPSTATVAETGLGPAKARELYEDVCCALVLRFASEIFRVIPQAVAVHMTGYLPSHDPATGQPARDIYLRITVNRERFERIDLDYVDPSTAFDGLGGAKRTRRGELVPIACEPQSQAENEHADRATESPAA